MLLDKLWNKFEQNSLISETKDVATSKCVREILIQEENVDNMTFNFGIHDTGQDMINLLT